MINLRVATICAIAIFAPIAKSADAWKPEIKFQLETADFGQTMIWVSGFGYALSAVGRIPDETDHKRRFCTPQNGYIGSKEILEILNEKFAGETISSEQATVEIMDKISDKYPCGNSL